jgi:hypothetical protein
MASHLTEVEVGLPEAVAPLDQVQHLPDGGMTGSGPTAYVIPGSCEKYQSCALK